METLEQKTERNCRVQARYDELMREGKRGHYETMFRVVREEVLRDREKLCAALGLAREGYASEAITGLPVQPVWRERTMGRIDEALGA
jgi:C4-dicarboxylate-specific signal transduction histidine kinase